MKSIFQDIEEAAARRFKIESSIYLRIKFIIKKIYDITFKKNIN